jgi:hypothetical protein
MRRPNVRFPGHVSTDVVVDHDTDHRTGMTGIFIDSQDVNSLRQDRGQAIV